MGSAINPTIIAGFKRHGKDEMALYINKHYDLTSKSSSWFACEKFIFNRMKDLYGYETPLECYNDRDNHRVLWYQYICDYNKENKAQLGIDIFSEADFYVGIRDKDELEGIKKHFPNLTVVWVDAIERKEPENSDSMNVTIDDADIVIDNNGSLGAFYLRIDQFMEQNFPHIPRKTPRPQKAQEVTEGMSY